MKRITFIVAISSFFAVSAQDNLINAVAGNKTENTNFRFTPVINLERTEVKDQGSSGTCWSYAGASFLESEMLRMGKKPIDLSEMFTARNTYLEKAKQFVRFHGNIALGEGAELHDVINMYAKYGAVPQYVYTGLKNGETRNDFGELSAVVEGFLNGLVKREKIKKLSPNWEKAFTAVVDAYLGDVPESFLFNGKKYTPKTFASEVVGINANDYIEFLSYENEPKYKNILMAVPDNWSFDYAFNVNMTDFTKIIDNALKKGFTVAWAADVSERYFSWINGVAFVPEQELSTMSAKEINDLFKTPPTSEKKITPEMRQAAFDNYETTDDHAMHIVGVAKDQNGNEYYMVKNSWGTRNDYEGYIYVSKAYVAYKTTAILLHKDGVPSDILKNYKK